MEQIAQATTPSRLTSAPRIHTFQIPGLDIWQRTVSTMTTWNSCALSSASQLHKGWLDFVNDRLEADANHFKQLTACKCPTEWWHQVSNFVEAATHDYQDHLSRVANISSEVASVSVGAPDQETHRNGSNGGKSDSRPH